MGKHYYYEVDYRCDCEACGKQFGGVIRRGPLEYAGGVIPTGIGAAVDAADMQLSRKLIQSRIDGTGNQPFEAVNADHCPYCGARQSWYPMGRPVKPGGIGGYLAAGAAGMVLGLIIWLLIFTIGHVPGIVSQSGDLMTESISTMRLAMSNLLTKIGESTDPGVADWIRNALTTLLERLSIWGTSIAQTVGTFVVNLATAMPYSIIYISFLTIGLYFIAKEYEEIRSYLPGGKRRKQDSRTTQLTNSTVKSLFGYLRVQGTFALIVGIVSWIYLTCFGFSYAGITALFCGVMELVPMIGSGVPYIIMSVIQFLLGNTAAGFQILFLTLGLQLLRRVLEPKLMSDSIGITPLESLIGMFVGMRFGGIIGLIGGPVLMSVLVGAFKGGLFASTARDFHLISVWMKNRLK